MRLCPCSNASCHPPVGSSFVVRSKSRTRNAPWTKCYEDVRRSYESDTEETRKPYRIDPKVGFAESGFEEGFSVEVSKAREVNIPKLVRRALSKSKTSPAILGDRRSALKGHHGSSGTVCV
jgi:hypothetical protein